MNTNPPNDTGFIEGDRLPQVIYIDKVQRTCLVRVAPKRSIVCTMSKNIAEGIQLLDHVDIRFSPISKEWQVKRYYVNREVTEKIGETYQAVLI